MVGGRLGHGGITAAFAEAREVEGPGVETAGVPIVHPAAVAEVEADRQCRREGGAVYIKDHRGANAWLAAGEQRRGFGRRRYTEGLLDHRKEIGTPGLPLLRPRSEERRVG